MDKYAQLKRFHCERWLQFYMHSFMYVDPDKMSEDDCFPDTKTFANYKKM